jgi:PAS domain S-box-containing protein
MRVSSTFETTAMTATAPPLSDAILETLSEAVLIVDLEFRILRINRAAELLYNVSNASVAAWPLRRLIGEIPDHINSGGLEVVRRGEVWRGVVWHQRPAGTRFLAEISVRLIEDHGVIVALVHDVTQRENAANCRQILNTALTIIAETSDFTQTVEAVLRVLVEDGKADAGICRVREDQSFRIFAQYGIDPALLEQRVDFTAEEAALLRGEVQTSNQTQSVPIPCSPFPALGFRIGQLVGQRTGQQLVGTLGLLYRSPINLDLSAILPEIADALGARLEQYRQWRELKGRNTLLELMGQIDRLSLELVSVQSLLLNLREDFFEIFGVSKIRIGHVPLSQSSMTWLADASEDQSHPPEIKPLIGHVQQALVARRSVAILEGELSGVCIPIANSEGTLILELTGSRSSLTADQQRDALLVATQLALVVSRTQDRERLLRERASLEALALVSNALRNAKTQAESLQIAADYALKATRASTTIILLASEDHQVMTFGAVSGINAQAVLDSKIVTRERGLSWRVLDTGRPRIEDIAAHLPEAHTVRPLAQGAYIGIPIFQGQGSARRTIGVFAADTQADGERFTPTDLDSLTAVAEALSSARERLEALEEAEQRAVAFTRLAQLSADLESLDDVAIAKRGLEGLLELPGLEAAAYFVLDGDHVKTLAIVGPIPPTYIALRESTPILTESDLFGRAMRTGEVQIIDDYTMSEPQVTGFAEFGFRLTLVAPILLNTQVKAFLAATSFSSNAYLPANSLEIVDFLAKRVSRAIEWAEQIGEILSTRASSFRALGLALELRDFETRGHTDRVVALCLQLGEALGLTPLQLQYLEWGALLHDIGKIAVADSILLKPGKLTPAEWEVIREHPMTGFKMLNGLHFLPPETLEIVLYHQERLNGSGYPLGSKGDQIPYLARLFAVVDVFDALISERPYKHAWTLSQSIAGLRAQAGVTLQADLVSAFIGLLETP